MTTDAMLHALRAVGVGAVSLYASWKSTVGADVCVQETDDTAWHGVGRLGFDPLTTNGPYAQTGHPKALELLRTGLVPSLLTRLPDRSTTTLGPGWILQILADGTATFRHTAPDPMPAGSQALCDALAGIRAETESEVALQDPDSAHLRLAQAALGVCPAALSSLRHHAKADGANTPRLLTWPGVALVLPDARLPREAQRPYAVRFL